MHSADEHAHLFQPHTNYRTLDFDKPLSTRMVQKIVKKWADYSRLGDLSSHRPPLGGLGPMPLSLTSVHFIKGPGLACAPARPGWRRVCGRGRGG